MFPYKTIHLEALDMDVYVPFWQEYHFDDTSTQDVYVTSHGFFPDVTVALNLDKNSPNYAKILGGLEAQALFLMRRESALYRKCSEVLPDEDLSKLKCASQGSMISVQGAKFKFGELGEKIAELNSIQ